MGRFIAAFTSSLLLALSSMGQADGKGDVPTTQPSWPQWRGPTRDGQVSGPKWPDRMARDSLELLCRVSLDPSYAGPIVTEDLVFTTQTRNRESEVVLALDRRTGDERWRAEWKGAMTVPFFVASNGSWIRSTPAYDGDCLYVAGMRDVLVPPPAKSMTHLSVSAS